MFLTKNNVINELEFYDIPDATRALNHATTIDKKREIMGCFVDPAVVQELDDTTVDLVFNKIKDATEYKIRNLIRDKTGQVNVPVGTEVKLTSNCHGLNKGTEGVIKECIRFEDNTFGQGWYAYDVEISNGAQLLRMYSNEFIVISDESPLPSHVF